MSIAYWVAPAEVKNLVADTMTKWHPDLVEAKVKIGILMAANPNSDKPAVSHRGHAARATVRIVPLKDRVTKQYDAEILIDADNWQKSRAEHHYALIDHELSHVAIKRAKPKKKAQKRRPDDDDDMLDDNMEGEEREQEQEDKGEIILDDLGRPVLKLVKGDWDGGDGFVDVVARHGDYAPEVENADAVQARLNSALEQHEANRTKIKMTADEADNMSIDELRIKLDGTIHNELSAPVLGDLVAAKGDYIQATGEFISNGDNP